MKNSPLVWIGAALLMAACKEKPVPEAQPATPPQAEAPAPAAAPTPAYQVPESFKASLGKVFEGYAAIQTALAQDDLTKAKEAFGTMHAVLHMMPKEGMDSAALAAWNGIDARIMESLHPLAEAKSLDGVRTHFMAFSQVLTEAIEKFGISGTGPVHQFHCPMANNNQGAGWLQKGTELENPYFGKAMLKCGNKVRSLKG